MKLLKKIGLLLSLAMSLCFGGNVVAAEPTKLAPVPPDTLRILWSHYTGWEIWQYIADSGILDKHCKQNGVKLQIVLINDYVESINLYTADKSVVACAMTQMDALTTPAVGGIDSTALIIGDFSNGNDGIVAKNARSVKDLKGRKISLVELTVSHYLLARALSMNGMVESDITVVNTSDADIASVFVNSNENGAVTTWNPQLMEVRQVQGAKLLFSSAEIPREIIDCLFVKSDAKDAVKKTIVDSWCEAVKIMGGQGRETDEMIAALAKSTGGTVPQYLAQLKTTRMFYDLAEAAEFAESADLKKTMEYVRQFSFDHGLFGTGAASVDYVGIEFPDKSIMGNTKRVKLRFDSSYMKQAAARK
jgi:NitT/TauT family transport system substrate-binding protein